MVYVDPTPCTRPATQKPSIARTTAWISGRPDLQAAEQAQQARCLERVAVATTLLPRVVADIGWNGTDNETVVASNWTRAGVTANWSLGAGGRRAWTRLRLCRSQFSRIRR